MKAGSFIVSVIFLEAVLDALYDIHIALNIVVNIAIHAPSVAALSPSNIHSPVA